MQSSFAEEKAAAFHKEFQTEETTHDAAERGHLATDR